jgi:hypothetical protein
MRKALLITVVAVLPLLGVAGYATANDQSDLAELRQATVAYHDIAVAKAEFADAIELPQVEPFGTGTCIENLDGSGAMGIHLLIPSRVDGNLVLTEPEALLYEKRNDGTYKLTGVEYVVAGEPRPTLFGQEFASTNLARYGNPDATVWTLHAWVWTGNPAGTLEPWNPNVSCG